MVVGALYNTTGSQAVLDIPSQKGAHLAASLANAKGGVLGRPIKLIDANGNSDVETMSKRTAELVASQPNLTALVGLSDTDLARAAGKVAAGAGQLLLTSGATSPKLPAEVPEYLYLACFGDNVQAAAAAEWAYDTLGARRASVVFDSGETYTRLLQQYFRDRFEALGGTVVSVTSYKGDATKQLTEGLKPADIVFLAAEQATEALAGVKILRAAGFKMPILGGDGYDAPAVWAMDPEVKDVYFTTHGYVAADNPKPLVRSFRVAFAAANPGEEPDSFTALGYDAVGLLIDAITRAGSDAPDKVRLALAATKNYEGVTGTIGYETGSQIPRKSVALISVVAGKTNLVKEVTPKSVPAP